MSLTARAAETNSVAIKDDRRGIIVEPTKSDAAPPELSPLAQDNSANAGLFVGVNRFADNSISPLRFAVNDAIAQAHRFVMGIKLVPPGNTRLLLSGEPGTPATQRQLAELTAAGVVVNPATLTQILTDLQRTCRLPGDSNAIVIVSFSSHGFEEEREPYIMPADGLVGFLQKTGLGHKTVETELTKSRANKRLLIVDACREKATQDTKSLNLQAPRMTNFIGAGQAVLASCDVGEFSYEDAKLGHGVFTYYLMEALSEKGLADSRNFITLGMVENHLTRGVESWVRGHDGKAQRPWFKGPGAARDIPLAFIAGKTPRDRSLANLYNAHLTYSFLIDTRMQAAVESTVKNPPGRLKQAKEEDLLEMLALLQKPSALQVRAFVAWWNSVTGGAAPTAESAFPRPGAAWTNGLGMVLVPVPGTKVLFSIWKARVRDFREYVASRPDTDFKANVVSLSEGKDWDLRGHSWDNPGFPQTELHPVCGLSWEDATRFCGWLTAREQADGRLQSYQSYRLPSDLEWSTAVGLELEAGPTPADRSGRKKEYLWGTQWPPPPDAGNYAGSEAKNGDWPITRPVLKDFKDAFARTSPVGAFKPNAFGLYDLGGNLWEWCDDWYDLKHEDRVLRGGAWTTSDQKRLQASHREPQSGGERYTEYGFRVVLVVEETRK